MKLRKMALSFDDVLLRPNKFEGDTRSAIDISTHIGKYKLDIPIIAANMPSVCEYDMALAMGCLGGLGIVHRMQSVKDQSDMVYKLQSEFEEFEIEQPVGAAVGIGDDWEERASSLIEAGAQVICLDVAHGHQSRVLDLIPKFVEKFPDVELIAGNVATEAGAVDLAQRGAHVKVGVGGGSVCTTRIQTGCGVPTLQSVMESYVGIRRIQFEKGIREGKTVFVHDKQIIADGGIKNSGDIVKSLAGGANAVMLGSLLAGTDEAPGSVIKAPDGKKYKIYRGAASFGAKKEFFGTAEYVEGEETLVPYRGPVSKVVKKLCEGIRSGFSYVGAHNIDELHRKSDFVQISTAGMKESKPHGLL